jgi:hypothetical protein
MQSNLVNPSDALTGVAGHVSNSLFIFELLSDWFRRFLTSTHLAPSLCEPGRVGHPIDFRFPISDFRLNEFLQAANLFQSAIGNRKSAITKILPTLFSVPGGHAPGVTSPFQH